MKVKTVYICSKCQHTSPKWEGKCSTCNEWDSYVENVVKQNKGRAHKKIESAKVTPLTVLQKYCKMNLSMHDVFINIAGGIKIKDPGCDLALLASISSSFLRKKLPSDSIFIGEVGLCGEIRPVPQLEKRIKETKKLGFNNFFIPPFTSPPPKTRFISSISKRIRSSESAAVKVRGVTLADSIFL